MKRIVQVGVGGMGQVWTALVAESSYWEASAYVDNSKSNLMAAATRHGMPKPRCFRDVQSALQSVEADALLDVTPQQFRKEVCLAAFGSGLDVLCEKPLADTMSNALDLVRAAEAAGCTLMVAQNYRYQAIMQTARRFIAQGRLGAVGYVGVSFHKGPHFGGYREEMVYPLLLDMSIHHFDLLRFLLDADVVAVQGQSSSAPWNWNRGDATLMAQLEMSTGVVVNYLGSWVSTGWETDWNAHWRIEGSKGVLMIEGEVLYFSDKAGHRRKVPLIKYPLSHQACLLDLFAKSLDKGTMPETSGINNLNSLGTTHAMVRAVEEQRRVSVRELLE